MYSKSLLFIFCLNLDKETDKRNVLGRNVIRIGLDWIRRNGLESGYIANHFYFKFLRKNIFNKSFMIWISVIIKYNISTSFVKMIIFRSPLPRILNVYYLKRTKIKWNRFPINCCKHNFGDIFIERDKKKGKKRKTLNRIHFAGPPTIVSICEWNIFRRVCSQHNSSFSSFVQIVFCLLSVRKAERNVFTFFLPFLWKKEPDNLAKLWFRIRCQKCFDESLGD